MRIYDFIHQQAQKHMLKYYFIDVKDHPNHSKLKDLFRSGQNANSSSPRAHFTITLISKSTIHINVCGEKRSKFILVTD